MMLDDLIGASLAPADSADAYDPSGRHICPECGRSYSGTGGGHCRGGAYGGCCRTFTSDTAADAHRTGPYSARRCLTDEEMAAAGFRSTDHGWTNSEPMPEGIWKEGTA